MTAAFRLVAVIEAATYLVLLAAVVTYRVFDGPDYIGVLGPIHGIAFLVYFVLVLRVREDQGWNVWQSLLVLIAAAVPIGGFLVAGRLVDPSPTPSGRPRPS